MGLPKQIDPIQCARQQARLTGELLLKDFLRLQEIAPQKQGVVTIDLQFGVDDAGSDVITGQCGALIQLICQRCNKTMEKQIDVDVFLSPVISESQATRLPADYEPLVTNDEMVSLTALVEDELLLALPMVPMHPEIAARYPCSHRAN